MNQCGNHIDKDTQIFKSMLYIKSTVLAEGRDKDGIAKESRTISRFLA